MVYLFYLLILQQVFGVVFFLIPNNILLCLKKKSLTVFGGVFFHIVTLHVTVHVCQNCANYHKIIIHINSKENVV